MSLLRRYAWVMPRREDDDVARRTAAPTRRNLVQAGGFALAALATLAVFLTENAQYLRIAVVAVAWAFVLATFAAGRRDTDRVAAAAREAELRRAYELELEREVSARREYELELENELRRETEDSMRYELDALRGDIAALGSLREEVARVSALRGDIVALSSLRDDVARVAALRDDVAALSSLRQELGQLGELRADMGRLRAELTEQLSSEMLVERIVMRTQAGRLSTDAARVDATGLVTDGSGTWRDDVPPRELTGGWPAIRLDEPRATQQFEQVRVERSGTRPPAPAHEPATASWETVTSHSWSAEPAYHPPTSAFPAPADGAGSRHAADEVPPAPPTAAFPMAQPGANRMPAPRPTPHKRSLPPPALPAAGPPTALSPIAPPGPEPLPSPLEWLAARSLLDADSISSLSISALPEVPPRRRRGDDGPADPLLEQTVQRPVVVPAAPLGPPSQEKRLADILAENGVTPATGGRRRRRYREEGEPDDVLSRVLRGN